MLKETITEQSIVTTHLMKKTADIIRYVFKFEMLEYLKYCFIAQKCDLAESE